MRVHASKSGNSAKAGGVCRYLVTATPVCAGATTPHLRRGLGLSCLIAALVCCSCGPQNYLDGSIEEHFTLNFDRVDLFSTDDELAIVYVRGAPQRDPTNIGEEQVARIVIDLAELDVGMRTAIRDETFVNHVHINRLVVANESFPPARTGEMHLEKITLEAGGFIKGEFDAVFVNGRVLLGAFEGTVSEPAIGSESTP